MIKTSTDVVVEISKVLYTHQKFYQSRTAIACVHTEGDPCNKIRHNGYQIKTHCQTY